MTESFLARQVDRRTLHFAPWGLGAALPPAVSEKLLSDQMSALTLPLDVPPQVRGQVEKLKVLYRDGLFAYDSFTRAERDACRVLEVALKVRFLGHYRKGLPLVSGDVQHIQPATRFEDVRRLLGGGRNAGGGLKLEGHPRFNASLAALMRWARSERYLCGQRNRRREDTILRLRNHLTHSEHDTVVMPPDAFRTLRLVIEMISRLWGHDTVGGVAYPAPLQREPYIVGFGPGDGEGTWFPLDLLPTIDDEDAQGRIWHVVLATDGERLVNWRAGFELTQTPVLPLWGPGSWERLHSEVERSAPGWAGDGISILDRLFYLRVVDGKVEPPRSAEHVQALRTRSRDDRWYVVMADGPHEAWAHVRGVLEDRCRQQGWCRDCSVEGVVPLARRETIDRFIRASVARPQEALRASQAGTTDRPA